jgi:hypothetical protein
MRMCKRYRITGLSAPFFALGVLLVSSSAVFAARLVRFQVSVDGKVVMQMSTGDNGSPDADAVWRELTRLELKEVNGFEVQPNRDNELRATLKGNVVVECVYAGRADLRELQLVKESEFAPWKIDPADVERTFKTVINHSAFACRLMAVRNYGPRRRPDPVPREIAWTMYGRSSGSKRFM